VKLAPKARNNADSLSSEGLTKSCYANGKSAREMTQLQWKHKSIMRHKQINDIKMNTRRNLG